MFVFQVALPLNEVELGFGEVRIKTKTLGDAEFTINLITYIDDYGMSVIDVNKTTCSVCVEDYDSSYCQKGEGNALSLNILLFAYLILLHNCV